VASSGYIAATRSIIDQFSSGGRVLLDNRSIILTDTIIESSDLGVSLGQENNLIMLPKTLLSGSVLMSSGSRLSNTLMLSIPDEKDRENIYEKLKSNPQLSEYQIRSYTERSEQNIDAVKQLTNYIQLILVVAAIFAGIILRSAHISLFADLSNTLRIVEILGLSRLRQAYIFLLIYTCIIPTSFLLSIGISYGLILFVQSIPSGSEFIFLISPIYFSLYIFLLLVLLAFSPIWINKLNIGFLLPQKIQSHLSIE
jgi:predicted lysophospholipase L1 biosynthesis ABC-type transport system permease subunit